MGRTKGNEKVVVLRCLGVKVGDAPVQGIPIVNDITEGEVKLCVGKV